jgi:hypothetical protein
MSGCSKRALEAFTAADAKWHQELVAAWGESYAAEARYKPSGRGQEGTPLRAAWEAREAARIKWEAVK